MTAMPSSSHDETLHGRANLVSFRPPLVQLATTQSALVASRFDQGTPTFHRTVWCLAHSSFHRWNPKLHDTACKRIRTQRRI